MAGSRLSTLCRHVTAAVADEAADADLLARFAQPPRRGRVRRPRAAARADGLGRLPQPAAERGRRRRRVPGHVPRPRPRGERRARSRTPSAGGCTASPSASRYKLGARPPAAISARQKAATGEAVRPVADSRWHDMLAAVHEEVARLPDAERTAFVVCCLEGVRQPDAAARLGWKPDTLSGRLSKAKQRLLDRLTRRGLAPAAALGALGLGATTGQALIPGKLLDAVLAFAGPSAVPAASVLQLSQGVLDMTITKVKFLAAAVLVAGGLATGFGASFFANADAQSAPPAVPPTPAAPLPPPVATPPVGVPGVGITPVAPKAAPVQPVPGGVARGPISRPWEYKFVHTSGMSVDQLNKTLTGEGDQGWELVTIEHRQFVGSGEISNLAIFKKAKTTAVTSPPAANPPATPPLAKSYWDLEAPPPVKAANPSLIPPTSLTVPGLPPAPAKAVNLYTISLTAANSAQMAKVLKELIAINEFGSEVTAVIADEGSNSLLVKASSAGKKMIEKQVKELEEAAAVKKAHEQKRAEDNAERAKTPAY